MSVLQLLRLLRPLIMALVVASTWTAIAVAQHEVNVDGKGVALHGYDPVAYFSEGKPVEGNAKYTTTQDGATYRFASAANRDAFVKEPARYLAQYGGYCAMGVALKKKLDGDPQVWQIVDGKLYLNVNRDIQKQWVKDVPGNIAKADSTWPVIRDRSAKDL